MIAAAPLTPGQALSAEVVLIDRASVLVVPNAALVVEAAGRNAQSSASQAMTNYKVQNADGTWIAVQLGEQGGVMSEIKSGISAGTALKLMPSTGTESARGTDTGKPTGRPERRGREGRE